VEVDLKDGMGHVLWKTSQEKLVCVFLPLTIGTGPRLAVDEANG
jgi:hypothetical protein